MDWFKRKRIFLDYASATPVLPAVRQVMEQYWSKNFYNASAIYAAGVSVKKAIEHDRARMARMLGVSPNGVIFTAGGTESDNLAVLGVFEKSLEIIKKPHIIISAIEHPAVTAAAAEVVRRGGEMSTCEVNEEGVISIAALKKLLKENTVLVSIALANHEIGTIQPIAKIGRLLSEFRKTRHSAYPYLHTDASQAPSYLDVSIDSLHADLFTLDAAKIYGPKGIGLLVARRGVKIHPVIFGGGQEGGRRAGTANPALIAGFALALEIVSKDRAKESRRLENLRQSFIESIKTCLPEIVVNGPTVIRLPNIASVSVPGVMTEFILLKLDQAGMMVSVGSACSYDEKISGSPVIRALGKPELSESTLRFSFGRFTTRQDVRQAAQIFCRVACSMVKY